MGRQTLFHHLTFGHGTAPGQFGVRGTRGVSGGGHGAKCSHENQRAHH